jgi:hypothetical protein
LSKHSAHEKAIAQEDVKAFLVRIDEGCARAVRFIHDIVVHEVAMINSTITARSRCAGVISPPAPPLSNATSGCNRLPRPRSRKLRNLQSLVELGGLLSDAGFDA